MRLFTKTRKKITDKFDLVTLAGAIGYFWFSYFCIRLAIRYTTVEGTTILPSGLTWIGPDNSIVLWGILWGIGAVLGMVGAVLILWNKYKLFFLSSIVLFSLHFTWATAYMVGWAFYDDRLGWLNAGTYYAPLGLIVAFIMGAIRATSKRNNLPVATDKKELS